MHHDNKDHCPMQICCFSTSSCEVSSKTPRSKDALMVHYDFLTHSKTHDDPHVFKTYALLKKDFYPMNVEFFTERSFVCYADRTMLLLYTVAVLRMNCSCTLPTLQ
jgi:hypothetical protein